MTTTHSPEEFRALINAELNSLKFDHQPKELYQPITYFLKLGGKRMRPVLLLMATELFGTESALAMKAALGIELFHNFTLLHDDIMDQSPLRRSKPTVHHKWNENIAILSGDAMFVFACSMMMQCPEKVTQEVMHAFLSNALKVCEGQQFDMNFENESNISVNQYLQMIELKTGALLGASMEIGALIGGSDAKEAKFLYDFGISMGIAFQLQDDLLDVYGEQEKFGKQTGRDIASNKKTFLLIKALELCPPDKKYELERWLKSPASVESDKVHAITEIYNDLQLKELTRKEMNKHFDNGIKSLMKVNVEKQKKEALVSFATGLMEREN